MVSDAEQAMLLADLEMVKHEKLMAMQARTQCIAEIVEIKENLHMKATRFACEGYFFS